MTVNACNVYLSTIRTSANTYTRTNAIAFNSKYYTHFAAYTDWLGLPTI